MTATVVAWILLAAVAAYACGGGVDYGAGFWDLFAGGAERGERPRRLIDHAMEPVWEVNNVWLIFVLVLMWTGFPLFFQTVFDALWLPLALAAIGMVLRGAGFALRKPTRRLADRRVYGAVFAVASLLTPFFLGAVVGGVASGRITPGTTASADAWANPTSVIAGLLTVGATAFLGAVFLTADARRFAAADLVGYFRVRVWGSLVGLAVLVLIGLLVPHHQAEYIYHGLTHGAGLALVLVAAAAALVTAWLVTGPAAGWARFTAVGCVASVVAAWGFAQRPYLVPTSLTVQQAAGATRPLQWLLIVALIAAVFIGPAVAVLYRLDTRGTLEPLTDADVEDTPDPMTDDEILEGLGLVSGDLLAAATGPGAELDGITGILLLTEEDDFNALASLTLAESVTGPVHRIGPPNGGHGVVAPFTGSGILFAEGLHRPEPDRRYAAGARIVNHPVDGGLPPGHDLLFLVRPDGKPAPVTRAGGPTPRDGDIAVLLGPAAA